MGPSAWNEDIAAFVTASLPAHPGRILEVGCGQGWLTHRLAGAGHDVRGIDPEAPEGPLFERATLRDFRDPGPFGVVVAILSLHHIDDLVGGLDKIDGLLAPGGSLIVVEFAWDRFDDATAEWCLERVPVEFDNGNWLHRRCAELRERVQEGRPLHARESFRRWADAEGFHASTEILPELRLRWAERLFSWNEYLYPDLDGVTEAEERAAIGSGAIQALSFRFMGLKAQCDETDGPASVRRSAALPEVSREMGSAQTALGPAALPSRRCLAK
jgi:SAM-dependent methyltransferase